MSIRNKTGFTLPELLIAVLIIGVIGAIAMYTVNISRAITRDAKRVSDVSVLRSSLAQYWLQKASYPMNNGVNLAHAGEEAVALTSNGFVGPDGGGTVILSPLPVGPKSGEFYFYRGSESGYALGFKTERVTAFGSPGLYFAHSSGVDHEDVEK